MAIANSHILLFITARKFSAGKVFFSFCAHVLAGWPLPHNLLFF
jgi:hypothetical protein